MRVCIIVIFFGFFESELTAKQHRCHNFLHAVKKSTSEVKALGRERVLLWYKEEGKNTIVKFNVISNYHYDAS